MGFASDGDRGLAIYHMNKCIEWCCVFAQSLALIEGKHGHGSSFFLYDFSAYDGAGLVLHKLGSCATAKRAGWVGCVVVGSLMVARVTHGVVPLVEAVAVAIACTRDADEAFSSLGFTAGVCVRRV